MSSYYDQSSLEGQLLAGDPAAIGTVRRWIAVVLTSPRFWSLRREWQDLHQEVLRCVIESLERRRFRPQYEFRSYVHGIARNVARHALAQRAEVSLETIPEQIAETPEQAQAEARMFARRVLDGATPTCRELIRLYFLEQLSYEEIAEAKSLPVGTVKSRLFRCLTCARGRNQRPSSLNVDS